MSKHLLFCLLCVVVKVAELWDRLTWLRGRSFGLLRTTSWTLTQVGLEVSKVEATFCNVSPMLAFGVFFGGGGVGGG